MTAKVLSGIIYVLRNGLRSRECRAYGPCKSLHNRFRCWWGKRIFQLIFT